MLIASANALSGIVDWQNQVLFTGQDISEVAAQMAYIQLSLLGCAGYVKVGNSLTAPVCQDDSLEDYWFTPMYFSAVWQARRLLNPAEVLIDPYKK